jgi:hypothetical protein
MRRVYIIAIIISLASFPIFAQDKQPVKNTQTCSCGFQSLLQGGLLEGESGPSWHIQTINGVYYKTWFAGVGVGLDYYTMRTIPLFLDVRKDIFNRRRTPFLYIDGGIHFDWLKSKEKPGWGSSDYNRGFYYDAGAGYKFGFGKRDALLVSAGFTMKTLRETRIVIPQCVQPPCNPTEDYYKYKFSRLSLKVGWMIR